MPLPLPRPQLRPHPRLRLHPQVRHLLIVLAGALLVLVPAACDFPGPAVTVAFTSHTDGQRIVGARTVTVSGVLHGVTPSTFALTLNGKTVPLALPTSGTFSASVGPLRDGGNTIVATATASGETSTATLHLVYPYLSLKTSQAASRVIGQGSFTTSSATTTRSGLALPEGAPTYDGNHLYIADTGNHRLVGMNGLPAYDGTDFSILLGQTSWTASDPGVLPDRSFDGPSDTVARDGRLLAADPGHNRVVIYQTEPATLNKAANLAVGQTSLTATTNTTCDDVHLKGPRGADATPSTTAGGRLFVADTLHNRVLIWDSVPATSGAPADLVLGQPDFTSCQANRNGAATLATLFEPAGVWSDGTRLIVADTKNNRVLIWTTFPTSNGQPADVEISLDTLPVVGTTQLSLNGPTSVSSNGNQLFVADTGNNRVLGFHLEPGISMTPDFVLGQADFSSTSANRNGSVASTTLSDPHGIHVIDGELMVADTGNSRALFYKP